MKNNVTEMFDIDMPIFAFSHCRDVVAAVTVSVAVMLVVVFAARLAGDGTGLLATLGTLAWPWYVPLGTALTIATGMLMSLGPGRTT